MISFTQWIESMDWLRPLPARKWTWQYLLTGLYRMAPKKKRRPSLGEAGAKVTGAGPGTILMSFRNPPRPLNSALLGPFYWTAPVALDQARGIRHDQGAATKISIGSG
jgi:hypothetical protein